jgi:hypothetical protein
MAKVLKFNNVLKTAKFALDDADIPFHLHSGTALGAYREKSFIPHDHDIDLAVFYWDVNTPTKLDKLVKSMKKVGFIINSRFGRLNHGYEIQFELNGVPLDIFWIYEGKYRNKDYYILDSYLGMCDKLPKKRCVWGYNPYNTVSIKFLGENYKIVPKKTLVDIYGKDWNIVKKFDYEEGIISGGYKGLIKDYYKPRPTDKKIAFCFMLNKRPEHQQIWEQFFAGDDYPVKSYTIYAHTKNNNEKDIPQWIKDNKIRSIKTGWCEENLVHVWINLLKTAYKDPGNKYFCLLSGSCLPLLDYAQTYKKIFSSKKSRINIDMTSEAYIDTGLYYADQWVILNRKHAKLLISLVDTVSGKKYKKEMKKELCVEDSCYCPDELYPINWFAYNYGKPSTTAFKKEFLLRQSTYTYWDGKMPHPIKFTYPKLLKFKSKICKSGSIFARKFNDKAAKNIGMGC